MPNPAKGYLTLVLQGLPYPSTKKDTRFQIVDFEITKIWWKTVRDR